MKATVRPEHRLLAVEREHDVHCMLELAVPAVEPDAARPPLHLALVIDRSGSMAGAKLETAGRCAAWLGGRLRPDDELALVAYDDDVRLALPRAPVDRAALDAALAMVKPGASTNLSGGWLKGVEQLRSSARSADRKILLLTDGMANVGITDARSLERLARSARAQGIGTTTIGFGVDFDEDLLTAMADAGGGNAHWAETPDAAPGIFAREFDGLTRLVAQNVSVEIRPRSQVGVVGVLNDHPLVPVPGGLQVELGDAYGGETRRVVFELHIPRLAVLGPAPVADVVLRYVTIGEEIAVHEEHLPLVVNAVSADDAKAVVADDDVKREVMVLKAARTRDEAIRLADAGDSHAATRLLRQASLDLRGLEAADPATAAFTSAQAALLADEAEALADEPMSASQRKRLRYESRRRREGRP